MPELPEVETVVRDLIAGGLPGLRVQGARVCWPKTVAAPAATRFRRDMAGLRFETIERRGKFVVARLSCGQTLLIHLRMTGRLELIRPPETWPAASADRVMLTLDDGRILRFQDPRKFGRIWLTRHPDAVLGALGPEPLQLSARDFTARLRGRSRQLKPLLLDQTFVAGMGNIYTDEALWAARLHPCRKADTLRPEEIQALWRAIKSVLRRGIRNLGTTLGGGQTHFMLPRGERGRNQEKLNAYGQTGHPCRRCGTPIRRILVGQRATHLCPDCQKRPRRGR